MSKGPAWNVVYNKWLVRRFRNELRDILLSLYKSELRRQHAWQRRQHAWQRPGVWHRVYWYVQYRCYLGDFLSSLKQRLQPLSLIWINCVSEKHLSVLQPLQWCCVDCVIHHERDVREEQKYLWLERASNNKRDCDVKALPIFTCEQLNMMTSVREERLRRMISIVACCHGAKLCAHAARDFRSQQNGAVARMWRSCRVQPSHKQRAIGAVRCKKEGMFLQPLRWCFVDCVIHHGQHVRE